MHGKACDMRIRPVTEADAGELLEIYRPYVEKTAITFEYEVPSEEEFRGRIKKTLERYPYLAAVSGGRIVGYAYTGPFKERAAYDWAVETSIYVRWGCGNMGIGRALYAAIEEISRRQHVINLNACIGVPQQEQAEKGSLSDTAGGTREIPEGEAGFRSLKGGDEYLTCNSAGFHEHMGYRLVGRFHRCGYKFGRWYDMVWMEKMLGEHPERPQPLVPWPELNL